MHLIRKAFSRLHYPIDVIAHSTLHRWVIRLVPLLDKATSNGLSIPGGLSFENDESERLYSPLANFKVTAVSSGASNTYHVTLEEVTKGENGSTPAA